MPINTQPIFCIEIKLDNGLTLSNTYDMSPAFRLEQLWLEFEIATKFNKANFITVYTRKPDSDVIFVVHEWDRHLQPRERLYPNRVTERELMMHPRSRPTQIVQLFPQGDHVMTSNMPVENAAQQAVDAQGSLAFPQLPTAKELLDQARAQQAAETQQTDPPTASFTPVTPNGTPIDTAGMTSNGVRAAMGMTAAPPSTTFDAAAQKALMHSMNAFVKAQSRFLHTEHLPSFAGAQEAHIIALTTALEQLGIL